MRSGRTITSVAVNLPPKKWLKGGLLLEHCSVLRRWWVVMWGYGSRKVASCRIAVVVDIMVVMVLNVVIDIGCGFV